MIEDEYLLPKRDYNETTHTFETIPSKYGIFPITGPTHLKSNLKSTNSYSTNTNANTEETPISFQMKPTSSILRKEDKILEIKISSDAESSSSLKNKSFTSNKTYSIDIPVKPGRNNHTVSLPDLATNSNSKPVNIECVDIRLPIRRETMIKIFSDNSIQIKPSNSASQDSTVGLNTFELNFNNSSDFSSNEKVEVLNIICRNPRLDIVTNNSNSK